MSLTTDFSVIDAALRQVAQQAELTYTETRVLLAIGDGSNDGGGIVSDDLEASFAVHDSNVRRALLVLYSRQLAKGVGSDGGPRRKGVRSRLTLTDAGDEVYTSIYRWVQQFAAKAAA